MISTQAAKTVLYTAWFCPFAQRVAMVLNELKLDHELVESLEIDPKSEAYIKHPDLLRHNPKGLVPTLVQVDDKGNENVHCESLPLLRDLFLNSQEKSQVEEALEEALEWNQRICSAFYPVLMRQDATETEAAWQEMKKSLESYSRNLTPFYKGASAPGLVDFAVYPFVQRLYIIEHFKGKSCSFPPLDAWKERMESRPSVKATLTAPKKLIPVYQRYSEGTAKSKVAEAVRRGKQAHDV